MAYLCTLAAFNLCANNKFLVPWVKRRLMYRAPTARTKSSPSLVADQWLKDYVSNHDGDDDKKNLYLLDSNGLDFPKMLHRAAFGPHELGKS